MKKGHGEFAPRPFCLVASIKKTVKPLMKRATVCLFTTLLLVLNPVDTPHLYEVAPPPIP